MIQTRVSQKYKNICGGINTIVAFVPSLLSALITFYNIRTSYQKDYMLYHILWIFVVILIIHFLYAMLYVTAGPLYVTTNKYSGIVILIGILSLTITLGITLYSTNSDDMLYIIGWITFIHTILWIIGTIINMNIFGCPGIKEARDIFNQQNNNNDTELTNV